jgi:Protein of unknown function (DUF3800)
VIYAPFGFLQNERRPLMAFVYHQVFCDESGKYEQDPLIAFSGVSATANHLAAFDDDWRVLLRSYGLDDLHLARVSRLAEDHGYRFRIGQTIDQRTDLLIPFADCINKHLEVGLIQAWSVQGYNALSFNARRSLGGSADPYFIAFVRGLAAIVDFIGEDDRIQIICDDDINTAWDCYNHYRALGKADPDIPKKAVAISFANDKHFPALQAADMVAFLARQEANEKFYGKLNTWRRLYDRLTMEPSPPYGIMRWFAVYADEAMLVDFANEANALAEKRAAERQEHEQRRKAQRISELQPNDGSADESSTRRDKSQVGRRETRKTKAEG